MLMALVVLSVKASAQKVEENGIIYKEHPYIEVVKNSVDLFMKADADGLTKLYADTAKFFDTTNPKWISLTDTKKGWQDIWDNWEINSIKQVGYPDALQYSKDPFTVQSWWSVTTTNKKTKKVAKFAMVQFDEFNKDGLIVREADYYDSSTLMEASK